MTEHWLKIKMKNIIFEKYKRAWLREHYHNHVSYIYMDTCCTDILNLILDVT